MNYFSPKGTKSGRQRSQPGRKSKFAPRHKTEQCISSSFCSRTGFGAMLGFSNPQHLYGGRLSCSPFWLRGKAFLFCPFFFWGKIIDWAGRGGGVSFFVGGVGVFWDAGSVSFAAVSFRAYFSSTVSHWKPTFPARNSRIVYGILIMNEKPVSPAFHYIL